MLFATCRGLKIYIEKQGQFQNVKTVGSPRDLLNEVPVELNDPFRELAVYMIIRNLKMEKYDFFPEFLGYSIDIKKRIFGVEPGSPVCFGTKCPLPRGLSASIEIRLLKSLFVLNGVLNISHNDICRKNILITSCDYGIAEYRITISKYKSFTVRIPTYGVCPMICDFGRSSSYAPHMNAGVDDSQRCLLS